MSPRDREPPVLRFLVGPTASGKSDLALAVAEAAGAELLSMDSMLVYRGMDMGTAKPDATMRARVPHHLMDLVGPEQEFSVTQWCEAAEDVLRVLAERDVPALIVGGTAFYMKSLVWGLFDGPPVDAELRMQLEERAREVGAAVLHAELAAVDPTSAERLHPNDVRRVVRGLEVWNQTGRTLSDWQREWGARGDEAPGRPHRIVGLAAPTEGLDERIRARCEAMLDAGWPEEARRIRDGAGFSVTSRQALGYAEVLRLIDGELDREACEREIALRTRQFARRQRTWLRGFPEIAWLEAPVEGEAAATDRRIAETLAALGLRPC